MQPQRPPQRVLDVLGENAVDRVGLVSRELRQPPRGTIRSSHSEHALKQAQQPGVDLEPVRGRTFAVAADGAAPGRGPADAAVVTDDVDG